MFDTRRCRATSPTVRKRSTREESAEELPVVAIRPTSIATRFIAARARPRLLQRALQNGPYEGPRRLVQARRAIVVHRHDGHVSPLGTRYCKCMIVDVHHRDRRDSSFDRGSCEAVIS